jgi:hypothetical protein
MRILVTGSITRLGKEFIRQANSSEILCATDNNGIDDNLDSLHEVLKSAEVIVSFRGGSQASLIQNILLMELANKYEKKFMLVTSVGCGDSWHRLSKQAKETFGDKIKYKSMSETWLKLSDLNWLIIRPTGLSDTINNERVIVTTNKTLPYGYLNRADLAKTLVTIIKSEWKERETLYVYTEKKS